VVALATAGDLDTSMPRGSFSHTDTAGNNTLRFTGRVHRHALPPGTYQLTAVASSNRTTSKPKTASFRIVR
jgi:hypothetical protein